MEKKKLLTVMVFCLIASLAMADKVISIDLNGFEDANAYSGEAAVPGATEWNVFYSGWGKPMSSPGANNLPDYNEPNTPATFTTQVWIGDPGANHDQYSDGVIGLMNDGFDANGTPNPHISLMALGFSIGGWEFGSALDQGAFGGTFDIYVYGSGNFTVESPIYGPTTKEASGGFSGTFTENVNYVVFTGVLIDDSNEVSITYDGTINGLQLVKATTPTELTDAGGGVTFNADGYARAFETNRRSGAGTSRFGPDIYDNVVNYLDGGEWMEYDVNVAPAYAGQYKVYATLNTDGGVTGGDFLVYANGIEYGNISTATQGANEDTTDATGLRFFQGMNTFKWRVGSQKYFNIISFTITRTGDLDMNCALADTHGFIYEADFDKNCVVDANDLAKVVDGWVECYSPDANECY